MSDELAEFLSKIDAPEETVETTTIQTGRGPTGKLRNFGAMGDSKFLNVLDDIVRENNDPEAIAAVKAEALYRKGRG